MSQFSQFYRRKNHSPALPELEESDEYGCDASLSSENERQDIESKLTQK